MIPSSTMIWGSLVAISPACRGAVRNGKSCERAGDCCQSRSRKAKKICKKHHVRQHVRVCTMYRLNYLYYIYTYIYIYTAIYCSYVCVCMCIYTSINNRCTVVSYLWQRRHATEIGSLNAKLESERAQLESSHKEAQLRIFFEWMSIGNPGDIIRILGWNMDQVPSGKLT